MGKRKESREKGEKTGKWRKGKDKKVWEGKRMKVAERSGRRGGYMREAIYR